MYRPQALNSPLSNISQGQGPYQLTLSHYCAQPEIETIQLAFLIAAPSIGNTNYELNFGNNDEDKFADIVASIPVCQANGKQVLLSLGGERESLNVNSVEQGEYVADFLWKSFGPETSGWDIWPLGSVVFDGFDIDVERSGGRKFL